MQSAPYAVMTNLILRHLSFLSFLDGKLDRKASEMVFWVCKQIEGAVMRSKNVANEQKTETLALGLGRENSLFFAPNIKNKSEKLMCFQKIILPLQRDSGKNQCERLRQASTFARKGSLSRD